MLLLDNTSSHHSAQPLSNINIQMLPPNTTAHLQSQDAGIIAYLKAWIKRRQMQHALDQMEEIMGRPEADGTARTEEELAKIYEIDILEAMKWCREVWESATQSTIANCWTHTGIMLEDIYALFQSVMSI